MHCPAVSHAGITVCPVIHWYSFTCIWAVNIRCSPQITHKCCTPPLPRTRHCSKILGSGQKGPGRSVPHMEGHCEVEDWRSTVKCFLESQKERLSKCQIGCRPEKLTLYWATCTQGWLVYLSIKHQSSASSGYSLCHYFTINEKRIHSRT